MKRKGQGIGSFFGGKDGGGHKAKLLQEAIFSGGFHHHVYLPALNRQNSFDHGNSLRWLNLRKFFTFAQMSKRGAKLHP